MKGNTSVAFAADLLSVGGPKKEFVFRGKQYFMESHSYDSDKREY